MRIVIVTGRFAPSPTMGAITVTNLARVAEAQGHEVLVVASEDRRYPGRVDARLQSTTVVRQRLLLPGVWQDKQPVPASADVSRSSLRARVGRSLQRAAYPDPYVLWAVPAYLRHRTRVRRFAPDVVVCSGPPHSGLLLGVALARAARAPAVLHLRDLWARNPYLSEGRLRGSLTRAAEKRLVARSTRVWTSTSSAAETFRRDHPLAEVRTYRSYTHPDDARELPAPEPRAPGDPLTVVHTGSLYAGRRDPLPLVERLFDRPDTSPPIVLSFVGDDPCFSLDLVRRAPERVVLRYEGRVERPEALRHTALADVVFVLTWRDEPGDDTVPGKIYEAIALGRPILVYGRESEEIASLLGATGLPHCVTSDADEAARFLGAQGDQPVTAGHDVRHLLSRQVEAALLDLSASGSASA